jgi:hypothetical protein
VNFTGAPSHFWDLEDSPKGIRDIPFIASFHPKVETERVMKNFQVFLKSGQVRYAAADRIEVGRTRVTLYADDRIVATFEKSDVIMLDEFQLNGAASEGNTARMAVCPRPGILSKS